MLSPRSGWMALVLGVALAGGARAHVELATATAPAGSAFRAAFEVGHGCDGAPTTALRILIDERLGEVAPEPRDGWTLDVSEREGAAEPGEPGEPRFTRELHWSGGSLGAHDHGEFVVTVALPDAPAGTVIYFPIVQECGDAVHRWIETPLPGEAAETLSEPAPALTLTGPVAGGRAP